MQWLAEGTGQCFWPVRWSVSPSVLAFLAVQLLWNRWNFVIMKGIFLRVMPLLNQGIWPKLNMLLKHVVIALLWNRSTECRYEGQTVYMFIFTGISDSIIVLGFMPLLNQNVVLIMEILRRFAYLPESLLQFIFWEIHLCSLWIN